MATTFDDSIFDNGLATFASGATNLHLVSAYTDGDSLATVQGNSVATTTINSGDWAALTGVTNGRRATLSGGLSLGNATASASTPDLHWVVVDGTKVLGAADAPDQDITSGNPVTMSSDTTFDISYTP